ncbi:uncharacterized protein LOC122081750 [Macadamia integrifolia]|uniref:uncharacterized protein LOC122081750 n=1 Tax=Macadamia integrifolia TaxID=60698 RepID=UPI001C4F757F|nr:uncharacterized protein LOC122081750 [Macadamia integrifolia]
MDEEEIWKCQKHPSKRRTTGVCPLCLRDRLLQLCPNCANVRPCACCTSSSSSSSSSFSHSSIDNPKFRAGIGAVGRVSNLINSEPAFQRSRSNSFNFIRRRPSDKDAVAPTPDLSRGRSSLWSVFKSSSRKTKKSEEEKEEKPQPEQVKMRRSKSVGVSVNPTISSFSEPAGGDSKLKGRSWYFPSPMKVFRQPKTTKVVQEMSPLYRG